MSCYTPLQLSKYSDLSYTYSNKIKEEDTGKEYIYNDQLVGLYQEFPVNKIYKSKPKQERTLGIDLYNLYNLIPKKKGNSK